MSPAEREILPGQEREATSYEPSRQKRHGAMHAEFPLMLAQEKLKRMSPAEREKYMAKKEKVERERRARKMGKTMFK